MVHISSQHQRFLDQRAAKQEESRVDQYQKKIEQRLAGIDPERLTPAGVQMSPHQVSFSIPGAVFDGKEHKHLTVSFDLLRPNAEPKVYADRFPGRKTNEVSVKIPPKLYALEHRLKEENKLGLEVYKQVQEALKSGEGITEFSRLPNSSPTKLTTGGLDFSLVKHVDVAREDGSALTLHVHCGIRTDSDKKPAQYIVQVTKDVGPHHRRVLAGSSVFSSAAGSSPFDKEARPTVEAHLKEQFAAKRR